MIRIIVEDGLDVILEAFVDVPKRKVVSLLVEPSHPLRTIYVAEALLSVELEREMARLEGDTPTVVIKDWTRRTLPSDADDFQTEEITGTRPDAPTCEGGCE